MTRMIRLSPIPTPGLGFLAGLLTAVLVIASETTLASTVTVTTTPVGLQINVDGSLYTTPQVFTWAAGTQHTISAPSPQTTPGTKMLFVSWSDGGSPSHTITIPATDASYTANFSTQYSLTTTASPSSGGDVAASPTSTDSYYTSGTVVQLTASPAPGYEFLNWSGDATGTTNPTTIRLSAPRSVTANFVVVAHTVTTNPAGLQISVDGTIYTAPQTFAWTTGTQHTISTSSPQGTGPIRRLFAGWSDGGNPTHTVTAPATATTFTATFGTQYLLIVAASPSSGGTISRVPSSPDNYYNSGESVQLTAMPAADYAFISWTGDLSGSVNPTTVVMAGPRSVTGTFSKASGLEESGDDIPERFGLFPNYPNPFNPTTVIRYQLPVVSRVKLSLFDMLGKEVRVLVDEKEEAGYHEVHFDGSALASGVYIYRLQAGNFVQGKKLVLLR